MLPIAQIMSTTWKANLGPNFEGKIKAVPATGPYVAVSVE